MFRILFLHLLARVGAYGHWCDGAVLEDNLGDGPVDVYFAQTPLFNTNPLIAFVTGHLEMFHSAIIFKQPNTNKSWTLEMVNAARNVKGGNVTMATGFFPDIDGDTLTWGNNDARYCFTDGVLNGEGHYTKSFVRLAEIEPQLFKKVLHEFLPTVNGTAIGISPKYNFWRVKEPLLQKDIIDDTTCSHGAIWVRDYLASQGVPMLVTDLKVTRATVLALSISYVDPWDAQWADLIAYYRLVHKVLVDNDSTEDEKKALFKDLLPLKYVYDPVRERYFKLEVALGTAIPGYVVAPQPWAPSAWYTSVIV